MKDVDVGLEAFVFVAAQKMAWQPDAVNRHLQAFGDGHVDHRERDGNARPRGDHFVQAAVAGVVVVALVARKSLLLEQEIVQHLQSFDAVILHPHPLVDLVGVGVEDVDEGRRIETGELYGCQFKSREIQRSVGFRACQDVDQRIHGRHG